MSIDIREFCLRTRYNPFHLNKHLYVPRSKTHTSDLTRADKILFIQDFFIGSYMKILYYLRSWFFPRFNHNLITWCQLKSDMIPKWRTVYVRTKIFLYDLVRSCTILEKRGICRYVLQICYVRIRSYMIPLMILRKGIWD